MNIQQQFYNNLLNGQQFAMLRNICAGAVINKQALEVFFDNDYQRCNPKTVRLFKEIFLAVKNNQYIDGKAIKDMDLQQRQQLLLTKIKQGKQISALALVGNGTTFTPKMVQLINSRNFAVNHAITHKALIDFTRYHQDPIEAAAIDAPSIPPTPVLNQLDLHQTNIPNNGLNLIGYHEGDGMFVNNQQISHEKIQQLKQKHQNNPVLQQAFKLIAGIDEANKNDVLILQNYIKNHQHNNLTTSAVINALKAERDNLRRIYNHTDAMFNNYDQQRPVDDSIKQLIRENGLFDRAIALINANPELIKGEIRQPFCDFRNRKLGALKTVLAITAKLCGAKADTFDKLNGFYKAYVPKGNNYSANLLFDKILYVPANSYVLGADQIASNDNLHNPAAVTDCSGFMTNIMRKIHPEVTWLKNHRFQSWGLEEAHDIKFSQRNDVVDAGPIRKNGQRRHNLTQQERNRLNNWQRNNPEYLDAVDKCFETVKNRNDIKAGDFLVYRQFRHDTNKSDNATGHVALVADYDPGKNQATILEYTRDALAGGGFTKGEIAWGAGGNSTWETRVLRPKLNK